MCTYSDIWQKVNSPYGSVWKKKKRNQHGMLTPTKTDAHDPEQLQWLCARGLFLSKLADAPPPTV